MVYSMGVGEIMTYEEWAITHEKALEEENEELIGALEDIFWDYTYFQRQHKKVEYAKIF